MKLPIGRARAMRPRPIASKKERSTRFKFDIVLGSGFRDHTVAIMLDGRDVYRRAGVTTNPATSEADALVAMAERPRVRIVVCATPGELMGVVECDLSAHRHVAISLIGKATLSVETCAREFTRGASFLLRARRA